MKLLQNNKIEKYRVIYRNSCHFLRSINKIDQEEVTAHGEEMPEEERAGPC
jgi:hypothetical protein